MIRLRWKNTWINFSSLTWSGSDNQCSREVSFSLPRNPYDKSFVNSDIAVGDLIYVYNDKKCIFLGTCTSRELSASIGTSNFIANDFLFHLTKSSASYKFKNISVYKAIQKICSSMGVKLGSIPKYSLNVGKMYFDDANVYDVIIALLKRVKSHTGKNYMPYMNVNKLAIREKGVESGVKLVQGETITGASYTTDLNDMVNRVYIYNDKGKCIGKVQNSSNLSKYGVFQGVYTKESNISASKGAKALLKGLNRSATVDSIGNINAVSGKSIIISDKASGLNGKYFIVSDSHTFENNTHMMSLELAFSNYMEQGADFEGSSSKKNKGKKKLSNNAKCYHIAGDSFTTYHSSKYCSSCKGKKLVSSTVAKMKRIKYKSGKKKGKVRTKPCSKCWY